MELNQLRDATVGTYPFPFYADRMIQLARQTGTDRANAAEFLTQQRYARAERGTGLMPLTAEMRGTMLSMISSTPVSLFDLVVDAQARIMVLYLAAVRGGEKIVYEDFKRQLPALPNQIVEDALSWVCGMEAKPNNENPPQAVNTMGS